ncbi:MAG: transglycosylase SLT domain-containing protein [Candidatus Binatia bacterium]
MPYWASTLALIVAAAGSAAAGTQFTVTPALRPQVDFWVSIFATYGKHQIVIHDTERLDRVYSVLDFRDLARAGVTDGEIDSVMREQEAVEKDRVRALLLQLDADPDAAGSSSEQLRMRALFASDPAPAKYRAAADRLRGQRGLRERFAQGIQIAHAYFPQMEAIFARAGVPLEITRLPLVESTFNMKAYSKVGAAGVWQFMPGTARRFMRVDGAVDQRLDPLIATRAAAQFLRENYDSLGSWPLAIKAYNHGPAGMARAVRETGSTDIATIIREYRGPAFRFASRNFYPEFLAALHVERNYAKYFGDLALHRAQPYASVVVPRPMTIGMAARCAGTDTVELAEDNPSLLPPVRGGRAAIPAGFELRVPANSGTAFERCAASLPPVSVARARNRAPAARSRSAVTRVVHRVRAGQTLSGIAARYGCSVEQVRARNSLKGRGVRTGQVLRIPRC